MKIKSLFWITLILSSVVWGQGSSQTATDYIAKRIQFTLLNPPQPVPFASVSVSGNPGPATYYYWIVTQTSVGASSPAGPFAVTNAPNSLTGSNFNQISWSPVAGALSYDVLRTSNTGPPFASCNCAVATGVAGTTANDQSNSLNAYTVTPLDPNTLTVIAQNLSGALTFTGSVNFNGVTSVSSLQAASIQLILNSACNGTVAGTAWMPLGSTTGVPAFSPPANCTVTCASPFACQLTAASGINTNFISFSGSNITISNLVINGNFSNNTSGSCIVDNGGSNIVIEHNDIGFCPNHGFRYALTGANNVQVNFNRIHDLNGGTAILFGNTPASQGGVDSSLTNWTAIGNTIGPNIPGGADGVFSTGDVASTGYGIAHGVIADNTIQGVADTSIEVGEGSTDVSVTGNTIKLPVSVPGGQVGISARSAQAVDISGNTVECDPTSPIQQGIFVWHCTGGSCSLNHVDDPMVTAHVNVTGNTERRCTADGGRNVQINSGDNVWLADNKQDAGAAGYLYGGTVTNLTHFNNDDFAWSSNAASDWTYTPNPGNHTHWVLTGGSKIGIGPTAFTPTTGLLHIQVGGNSQALFLETNVAATDIGIGFKNTAENWEASLFNSPTNNLCFRDITGGVNALCLVPTSGQAAFKSSVSLTESAAPSGAAGTAVVYADSTSHTLKSSLNNGSFFNMTQTIGSGTVTTAGTAVAAGACQAQTGITITGSLTTDMAQANIGAALPATWQTGIRYQAEVTASGTCTVNLCNPTAASITPVATAVRCTVMR